MLNNIQTEKFTNPLEALRRYIGLIEDNSSKRVLDVSLFHENGTDMYTIRIHWSPSLKEVVERRITRE